VRKINTKDIEERSWTSPKGKFGGTGKHISQALGRDPFSTDIKKRHPFDIEICRVPPGKANCPYHSHSAQWEFYHVIAGKGLARHQDGITPIETGDAFLFEPGEPHQIINNSTEDILYVLVADNPIGESAYYPDSRKWLVRSPETNYIRSKDLEYYDGEE
jgi:uncharacterized cupin superfamily protein